MLTPVNLIQMQTCTICSYSSESPLEMDNHRRYHLAHKPRLFDCRYGCSFSTDRFDVFVEHVSKHVATSDPRLRIRYYACPRCVLITNELDRLTEHLHLRHPTTYAVVSQLSYRTFVVERPPKYEMFPVRTFNLV